MILSKKSRQCLATRAKQQMLNRRLKLSSKERNPCNIFAKEECQEQCNQDHIGILTHSGTRVT